MKNSNVMAKIRQRSKPAASSVPDDPIGKREIRLAVFEAAIDQLLSDRTDHDFVLLELRGTADAFVQYTLHDGALRAEVGSTGWITESEVLDKERIAALGCLGFQASGSQSNFARVCLPQEPRRLACLTELLFGAAYRPDCDFDVTVLTRSLIEDAAAQRRSRAMEA
jgi:hypothetical protein